MTTTQPSTLGRPTHVTGQPRAWWRGRLGDPYRAVLLCLLLVTLPFGTHRVYASDEVQYFAYVRSLWFDQDLDFTNEYTHFINLYPDSLAGFKRTNLDRIAPRGESLDTATGLPINFAPIGTAILWTPFFAIGHIIALVLNGLGAPTAVDGYSAPYIWAITIGSAVYAALALLLLYGLARRFVSQPAAFWATLAIWLGTPVIFYSHGTPAYSHAASIFAVTAFLLVWHRTRPLLTRRWWQWLALGALAGLVMAVREQDGIIPLVIVGVEVLLALPALLRERQWAALGRLIGHGGLLVSAWILVFTPQLVTYYVLNGAVRPNSNVTEKVASWTPSNAFDVVLSPQYGLVFWTPLVAVALLGLAWLWHRDRTLTLALALVFLATWYVSAVYSTGPSRGSFGARRFLNCTPIFLIGLAACFQALRERRLGALVPVISLLGIWWNLGLIIQFVTGLMDRQQLELGRVMYNQVATVPARLLDFGYHLLFDRQTFFKN